MSTPQLCDAYVAYQAHHYACEDCIAAARPRTRKVRCAEGQALRDTYAAGYYAADAAYQAHHFGCAYCIGAGVAPGARARCADGAALWNVYQAAGLPPHAFAAPEMPVEVPA